MIHAKQDLLVTVLKEWVAFHGPLVVLLEDMHIADSASWTLLARMCNELPSGLLVIATARPNNPWGMPAPNLQVHDLGFLHLEAYP